MRDRPRRPARPAGSSAYRGLHPTFPLLLAGVLLGVPGCRGPAPARPAPETATAPEPPPARTPPEVVMAGAGANANPGGRAVAPPAPPVAGPPGSPPPSSSLSIERVTLWCSDPTGPACDAAVRALGVPATPTDQVPSELLVGARDAEDDCQDQDLAPLLAGLATALGIDPANWHDNVGQVRDREGLAQTFSGSGCTNCCWNRSEPAVKAHVVDLADGPRFLVRVWEVGQD